MQLIAQQTHQNTVLLGNVSKHIWMRNDEETTEENFIEIK